ncbi:putative DNA ligase-like protein [Rubripirellula obstinata]|uniref:DNA ligase (ATP) n=1 Tax=Rubripirellula obstinata TaxID=406547 RepID=A0A5B1CPA8_9BACT|nr:ATP-dependent DNA ligase [Rubripirellula obstinata]KAA1262202.1 putative DNA ligase-like protein [Rubripirellula obstinata]
MIRFAELYNRLDSTTKTNEKIAAMVAYYAAADSADAAWATYFLSGNKLRRLVPTKLLRQWAAEEAGIPDWLFDESYHAVGDLAETLAMVVPPGKMEADLSLATWVEELLPIRELDEDKQRDAILDIWRKTPISIGPTNAASMRFVVMKLITGAFRVGVSKRLVTRAIAKQCGLSPDVISHRLMGNWEPTSKFYETLIDPDGPDASASQPYPFCLAHPIDLEAGPEPLGDSTEYFAEWKWDGIRGQLIRREGQTFIWSRGEELMENRWPEIESAAENIPDGCVLDGEILASLPDGEVLPFAQLQRRIARKKVGKKLLSEVPVVFRAFDLLEHEGADIRSETLESRRSKLESLLGEITHPNLRICDLVAGDSWDAWATIRETSRAKNAEGLMLKRKDGLYDVGRVRGTWWKWKIAPHTIDAVLIYAQKGHGKRASLFTDYTFALWDGDTLVPIAKAYSGLDDKEIRKVDQFVRKNTNDTFGPVRSVTPELVMEIAFEGLQRSTRHKSGIATRFPRIVRWRHDKQAKDANQLSDLLDLLPPD